MSTKFSHSTTLSVLNQRHFCGRNMILTSWAKDSVVEITDQVSIY